MSPNLVEMTQAQLVLGAAVAAGYIAKPGFPFFKTQGR